MTLILIVAVAGVLAAFGFMVFAIAYSRRRARHSPARAGSAGTVDRRAQRLEALRLGYRYADDLIYIDDTTVWAGFRLKTVTDETDSDDKIDQLAEELSLQLQRLVAGGSAARECMYSITRRPVDLHDWVDDRIRRSYDPTSLYASLTARFAERHARRQSAYREVQLHVKLGNLPRTAAGMTAAVRATAAVTQVADEAIDPRVVADFHAEARTVGQTLSVAPLYAEPLSRADLLWTIRRPLHGDIPIPDDVPMLHRPWGPAEFDLAVHARGSNRPTHVLLRPDPNDPDRVSYTATLVVAEMPAQMDLSKATAWIRAAANRGANVTWRFTLLPPPALDKRLHKAEKDLKDEQRNQRENLVDDGGRIDSYLAAASAGRKDTGNGMAGIEGQIRFAFDAPSLDALNTTIEEFISHFQDRLHIRLTRANRLQWRLLQERLPGNGPNVSIAPYQRLTDVYMFGLGLPTSGSQLGDNPFVVSELGAGVSWAGDTIGSTLYGASVVHLDWHVGPARNQGGGVLVVGSSGGGKSSLVMMKFILESEAGTRCVAYDPKFDFAQSCLYLSFGAQVNDASFLDAFRAGTLGTPGSPFQPTNPEFWHDTNIIDITRSRVGLLEPFAITDTFDRGAAAVETVLNIMLGRHAVTCEQWIARAINRLRDQYTDDSGDYDDPARRPTIMDVLDEVNHMGSDDTFSETERAAARSAFDYMSGLPRRNFGAVVFSREPRPLSLFDRRRTVITARNMDRPPEGTPRTEWTPPQQMSAGVIYLLVSVARDKLLDEAYRDVPMSFYADEGYVLVEIPEGAKFISDSFKQMRALKSVLVFITQEAAGAAQIEGAKDEDEASVNQINTVMAFRVRSSKAASKVLPLLGLPADDRAAVRGMTALTTGTCYIRDADDRVGRVRCDLGFRELLAATDTNASTRRIRQSVDPSADALDWAEITAEDFALAVTESAPIPATGAVADSDTVDLVDDVDATSTEASAATPGPG